MATANDARQLALIEKHSSLRLAHLWSISRLDGTTIRITDHDRNINDGANDYLSVQSFDPSAREASAQGTTESTRAIRGAFNSSEITESDIGAGLYDGAQVVERVVDWRYPRGIMVGDLRSDTWWIARVKAHGGSFTFELEGVKRFMRRKFGGVIGRLCPHQLGEGICGQGVDLETAAYKHTGTVTAVVATRRAFDDSTHTKANDLFVNGRLVWTSGGNVGVPCQVKLYSLTNKRIWLEVPLPRAIEVGDAYTVYAGCSKTIAECAAKFSNVVNFGGEPFVPETETALPVRV